MFHEGDTISTVSVPSRIEDEAARLEVDVLQSEVRVPPASPGEVMMDLQLASPPVVGQLAADLTPSTAPLVILTAI